MKNKEIVSYILICALCIKVFNFNINTKIVRAEEIISVKSDIFCNNSIRSTYIDNDEDNDTEIDDYVSCPGYFHLPIKVTPAKKTISRKKSFNIKVVLEKEVIENMEQEDIDALWENTIYEITYRSTKNNVASVNKNGKVKGKKKGTAIIKTTVTLTDGSESVYKTKVYVK